jgi:hypothetical protein
MALRETEQLTRMITAVALSRAICTIGELGIADHIKKGAPRPARTLATLTLHQSFRIASERYQSLRHCLAPIRTAL